MIHTYPLHVHECSAISPFPVLRHLLSQFLHFALSPDDALAVTADDGSKVVYPGAHALIVSRGHGDDLVLSWEV